MYCVYITFYLGNKLPLFYLGSSSVKNIENGYRGSVRSKKYSAIWSSELKNNPDLFKTKILTKCETRLVAYEKELKLQKQLNVIKNPLYINLSLACKSGFFGGVGKNNPMYNLPTELTPCYGRTGNKHPLYGISPWNKGKKSSAMTKKLISQNHCNVSGENNPRSKRWILTSPDGKVYESVGTIELLCKELGLGIQLLRKHLGKKVPSLSNRATHIMSKNSIGWKLEKIIIDHNYQSIQSTKGANNGTSTNSN